MGSYLCKSELLEENPSSIDRIKYENLIKHNAYLIHLVNKQKSIILELNKRNIENR